MSRHGSAERPVLDGGPTRRLFFALWPDEDQRDALLDATVGAVRASAGRPVARHDLHVTLAFVGAVPRARVEDLLSLAEEYARAASGVSLALAFRHLEHWLRAQVLCAVASEPAESARAFAAGLIGRLQQAAFAPDLKPFRPHVTVARKVRHATGAGPMPVTSWSFSQFALIESRSSGYGAEYSVAATFVLDGPASASS